MPSARVRSAADDPRARPGSSHSAAQLRVIDAALDLFVEHGVGGTSLQMIADRIGVTKAAVYHQFPTKEEIVLAAAGAELARVEAIIEAGEAEPDVARAQEVVVHGIVDLAVERRRAEGSLVTDPVIVRYYTNHKPFRQTMERLYALLLGGQVGPDARLSASMLTAAIGGAAMHPMVVDLDDEALRSGLLRLATRFLDPPPPRRRSDVRRGARRPMTCVGRRGWSGVGGQVSVIMSAQAAWCRPV